MPWPPLNEPLTVLGYQETALGTGTDAQAICILSIDDPDTNNRCYGLGISRNTITASLNCGERIESTLGEKLTASCWFAGDPNRVQGRLQPLCEYAAT